MGDKENQVGYIAVKDRVLDHLRIGMLPVDAIIVPRFDLKQLRHAALEFYSSTTVLATAVDVRAIVGPQTQLY